MKKYFCLLLALMLCVLSLLGGCSNPQEHKIVAYSLPVICITTKNNAKIKNKEDYVSCSIGILNAGEFDLESQSAKIKLRGNSTLKMPKKPYKIKFDEKVDLFGNGKAKTWVLLANYIDRSLFNKKLSCVFGRK